MARNPFARWPRNTRIGAVLAVMAAAPLIGFGIGGVAWSDPETTPTDSSVANMEPMADTPTQSPSSTQPDDTPATITTQPGVPIIEVPVPGQPPAAQATLEGEPAADTPDTAAPAPTTPPVTAPPATQPTTTAPVEDEPVEDEPWCMGRDDVIVGTRPNWTCIPGDGSPAYPGPS